MQLTTRRGYKHNKEFPHRGYCKGEAYREVRAQRQADPGHRGHEAGAPDRAGKDKLEEEYQKVMEQIEYYRKVLADERLLLDIIKNELKEIKKKYADERRTRITVDDGDIDVEDLIQEEESAITLRIMDI